MITQPSVATLPSENAARAEPVPPVIGRFQVRGEIGRGSNGVVYAAHDPVLGRDVALKIVALADDPAFRDRIEAGFLNEAKTAAGVSHPGIVTVFDAGKADRLAYIAMERLHGRDLHDVIFSGQRLGYRQIAGLMARVADAVHFAHKRGLVHRDLKPSNIFVLRDGKPKVLDFGVATGLASDPRLSQRRLLIGTPNYMSPEQALGRRLDARSDVFSLGTILYELIARRHAFEGATIEETLAHVISDAPAPLASLRPEAPPALLAIVERALEKDIDKRYQTAGELRNALAAFAEGTARTNRPDKAGPIPWRQRLRAAPSSTIALAAVLLAVAVAIGLALAGRGGDPGASRDKPATAVPAPADAKGGAVQDTAARGPGENEADARPSPDPRQTPPASAAEGFIALAVAPWGEVFVNGQSSGVAPPLSRLALAPGVYDIEIRNRTFDPYRARVEVRPGQTVSLQHRF